MIRRLAYCGLNCETCPIYIATRIENAEEQLQMRASIARACQEHYKLRYEAKDIGACDGCRAEGGRLFSACQGCTIRKCAKEKRAENCAYCDQYICKDLAAFFAADLGAKQRLDDPKRKIQLASYSSAS